MITMQDINAIEAEDCTSPEQYYGAIQRAINSGTAWSLQGSYGRAMMDAISSGYCMLGRTRARDYWGNTIPSRDDVQEGTKGSRGYVAETNGEQWAEFIEEL